MDRKVAELLTRHLDAVELLLGAMDQIIIEHVPEEKRPDMSKAIFRCVHELYDGVSRPIFQVYPDLHPDEECRPVRT